MVNPGLSKNIAIVEDEVHLRENYTEMLEAQGYLVDSYASKSDASAAFGTQLPDLVLLDIGLEDDIDGGFDLCRQLREQSKQLPIIFLTARNNDIDTISGLRLGADDYLSKDISLLHLNERISALFRRTEARMSESLAEVTNNKEPSALLKIDLERIEVFWNKSKVELTVTEVWILHALVQHPGHIKSHEQLMKASNTIVNNNTIAAQIKRIRNKFMLQDEQFDNIESVYGAGYRWINHS